jgi:hypothetical protein
MYKLYNSVCKKDPQLFATFAKDTRYDTGFDPEVIPLTTFLQNVQLFVYI